MKKFRKNKWTKFICFLLCISLNIFPLNYFNSGIILSQPQSLKIVVVDVRDTSGSPKPWNKTATVALTLSLMKYFEVVDRSKLVEAVEKSLAKRITEDELAQLDKSQIISAAKSIGINSVVWGRLTYAGLQKVKDVGEAHLQVEFYDVKNGEVINKTKVITTTPERVGYSGAKELIIEEAISSACSLAASEAKKNYDLSIEGGKVIAIRQREGKRIYLFDIPEGRLQKGGILIAKRNGEIIGNLEVIKTSRTYSEAIEISATKEIRPGDNIAVVSNSPVVKKVYAKSVVEGKELLQEAKPKKKSSLSKLLIGAAVVGGIAYVATKKKEKPQPVAALPPGEGGDPSVAPPVKPIVTPIELGDGKYGVEIKWEKSPDPTVVKYNVYRSEDNGKTWTLIKTIDADRELRYIDGFPGTPKQKILEPTKSYLYKVSAVNNKGVESISVIATPTVPSPDNPNAVRPGDYKPRPLAPENLRVIAWGKRVSLSWDAVTDLADGKGQIPVVDELGRPVKVGYNVYRKVGNEEVKVKEGILDTSFSDNISDVQSGVRVYYSVSAEVFPQCLNEGKPSQICFSEGAKSSQKEITSGRFPASVSISLVVDREQIAANGESTARLTATVIENIYCTKAPDGVQVEFKTDSGAVGEGKIINQGEPTKLYVTGVFQGSATAVITSSREVGTATVKATVIDDTKAMNDPARYVAQDERKIKFIGGSIEISILPQSKIPADGQTSATITAIVRDANGSYVKDGTEVQFVTSVGYIKEPLQKTKEGKVQVSIVSDTCAPCQDITCKPTVRESSATITATVPTQGIEKSAQIVFSCLDVKLSATPSTILANGVSTSTIRAEVRDEVGNFVPDETVVYFKAIASNGRTLKIDNDVLTINGIATAKLKSIESSEPLDVTVEAIAGGKAFTRVVKLEPPPVGSITLYPDPSITAAGKYVKLTAIVKDTQGYFLRNRDVTFSVVEVTKFGGGVIPPSDIEFRTTDDSSCTGYSTTCFREALRTDDQGKVEVYLKVAYPSDIIVRAKVSSIPTSVTAETKVKYANLSIVNLSATPNSILANGVDKSRIEARIIDMTKSPPEPLTGVKVKFETNKGSITEYVLTGVDGYARNVSLTADTSSGVATVSVSVPCSINPGIVACDDNYKETVNVVFNSIGPSSITLSVDPKSVPADGISTINLNAYIKDVNGNPVIDGTNIFFISSDENSVISPSYSANFKYVCKASTKNGHASCILRSSTIAQSVLITALWWDDPASPSPNGIGKSTWPPSANAMKIQTSDRVQFEGGPVANISIATVCLLDSGGRCSIPTPSGDSILDINSDTTDFYLGIYPDTGISTCALGAGVLLEVTLSDSNNNPVRDGTEVRFTTDFGLVSPVKAYESATGIGKSVNSRVHAYYKGMQSSTSGRVVVTSGEKKAEKVIYVAGEPHRIELVVPPSIPSGGRATISARVYDVQDRPVSLKDAYGKDREVKFSALHGTVNPDKSPLVFTGGDTHIAVSEYTAPTLAVGETKLDSITATISAGVSTTRQISVAGEAGKNYQITYLLSDPDPSTPEIDLIADGISNTIMSVTVRDLNNIVGGVPQPVVGQKVDFTITRGTITPFAVTDAEGKCTARIVSDTIVGMATITIKAGTSEESTFVFFIPGKPDRMTMAIEQERVKVGSSTTIRVDVRDRSGNKVKDMTEIAFRIDPASSGSGTIVSYEGTNVAKTVNGIASVTFTGTIPGFVRVIAEYLEANYRRDTSGILTTIGDPHRISLLADPIRLLADGVSRTTIVARVVDIRNNPVVDGTVIEFESSPSDNLFTNGAPMFSTVTKDGEAKATLIASRRVPGNISGAVTITARYSPAVFSTTEVYLEAGPPDRIRIVADRLPAQVIADGISQMTIYAIVEDRYRNSVKEGTDVTFRKMPATDTGEFLPDATVKTRDGVDVDLNNNGTIENNERDLKGVAQVNLMVSRRAGSVYVYCTAPSNPYSPTLRIDFLPGEPQRVTVSANPQVIPATADPASPSQTVITAEIRDENNNLVMTGNATFIYTGTEGAVFAENMQTSITRPIVSGKATAILNAPTSIGRGIVKVQVGTAYSEVGLQFIPSRVLITVSAAPSTVLTNGYDFSNITAMVRDEGTQSMVTGVRVLFGIEMGEGILSSSESISQDVEDITIRGRAQVRFISKKSNSLIPSIARVRATVAGAHIINTDNYVDITLQPYRPRRVENLRAVSGNNVAEIRWDKNPDTDLVVAYQIEKTPPGEFITPSPPTATSYIDSDVVNGTTYTYRVRAQSENTLWSDWSSPVSAVPTAPQPPGPPSNVRTEAGNRKVKVMWGSAAQGDAEITLWRVYRSAGVLPGEPMPPVGSFTNITPQGINRINFFYEDLGLTNGRVYYYYLTSVDKLGQESARSEIVFAMPRETIATPPAAPRWAQENAIISEGNSLILSWQRVTTDVTGVSISDNDSIPVVRYKIYRNVSSTFADGAQGEYQEIATVNAPNLTYTDGPALTPGWFYFYKVSAVREGGESGAIEGPKSDYIYGQVGLPAIVLYSPAKNAWLVGDREGDRVTWTKDGPIEYTWSPVKGATRYIVEFSHDPNMVSIERVLTSTGTSASTTWYATVPEGQGVKLELWWRVKVVSNNNTVLAVSETRHHTLASYVNQACDIIPTTPVLNSATAGEELVNLVWTANPPEDNVLEYWIYRTEGTTSPYILLKRVPANVLSYQDRDVKGETLYGYRISAINDCMRESQLSSARFATPTTSLPPLPSQVIGVVALSCDSMAQISWALNPPVERITNYRITRAEDINFTQNVFVYNTNSATVQRWLNTGLTNGKTYYYKVQAQNQVGLSSDFSVKVVTPSGIPSPAKNFTGTSLDGAVRVNWDITGAEQDIIGYYLYISTEASSLAGENVIQQETQDKCGNTLTSYNISFPPNTVYTAVVSKNTSEYTFTKFYDTRVGQTPPYKLRDRLANGTPYYVTIQPATPVGRGLPLLPIEVTPQGIPPAPSWSAFQSCPTGRCDTYISGQTAYLRWIPVWYVYENNNITYIGDIVGYNIYRNGNLIANKEPGILLSVVGNIPILEYVDRDLLVGSTYSYTIRAVRSGDIEGSPSSPKVLTAFSTSIPSTPTNFAAVAGDGQVTLSWAQNNETDLTNYKIYWSLSSSDLQNIPATVPQSVATAIRPITPPFSYVVTTYKDANGVERQGLLNGIPYYFRITAQNPVGESAPSNIISATPMPANLLITVSLEPSIISANAISTATITARVIDATTSQAVADGTRVVFSATGGTIYPISAITSGGYAQTTIRSSKISIPPDEQNITVTARVGSVTGQATLKFKAYTPSAPQGLKITAGDKTITLTWDASPREDTVVSYKVYRAVGDPPGSFSEIGNVSTTSYIDTGLTNGTKYHYRVSAVNEYGEGIQSISVSAIPVESVELRPTSPQGLTATPGYYRVTLRWLPNSEVDLYGYRIYWASTNSPVIDPNSLSWEVIPQIISKLDTQYIHTGLTNNLIYYYRITAINTQLLESQRSNFASAIPSASAPPAAPRWAERAAIPVDGTVAGNQIIGAQIILEWKPVTTDVGGQPITNLSKYRIYVSRSANGVYTQVGEVDIPSVTYTYTFNSDAGELRPTRYFRITAVNSEGQESPFSEEIYATVNVPTLELLSPQNDSTVLPNSMVMLHWSKVSGKGQYYVEYAKQYDPTCTKPGDDGIFDTPDDVQGCLYGYYKIEGSDNENKQALTNLPDPSIVFWRVTAKSIENRTIVTSYVWKYTVTSSGQPVQQPSVPTNLQATVGDGLINLTWDANDPNKPENKNVIGYHVYWGTSPYELLNTAEIRNKGHAIVPASANPSYTIRHYHDARGIIRNSLPNGTVFYIQVTAIAQYGSATIESYPTQVVSARPVGGPPPAPLWAGAPGTGCAHPPYIEGTTAFLNWRPVWAEVTNNIATYIGDIIGYNVYRNDVKIVGPIPASPVPECNIGSIQYIDSNLTSGVTYKYEVSAVSQTAGEGARSVPLYLTAFNNTPPTPPTGFQANGANQDGKVILTWNDNPELDVIGYRIYWALNPDDISNDRIQRGILGPTALYADVGGDTITYTVNRFTDGVRTYNRLANGTPYFFRLQAMNQAVKSTPTSTISATPTGAPPAPRWSTVQGAEYYIEGTTAYIRWLPVWDDNLTDGQINYIGDLQTYRIYRIPDFNGQPYIETLGERVGGTGYDVLQYIDGGLALGGYQYYITAVSLSGGEGPRSETKTLTATAAPQPPAAPILVQLTPGNERVVAEFTHPNESGDNIAMYIIYGGTNFASLTPVGAVNADNSPSYTFTITQLENNVAYYVRVRAVNQQQEESPLSNIMSATPQYDVIPAAPNNVRVTEGNAQLLVEWNASPSYEFVTSYQVWRAQGENPQPDDFEQIMGVPVPPTATFYIDTNVTNGTRYTYRIRAVNQAGESAYSAPASGIPRQEIINKPRIPTGLTATPGYFRITLNWTANPEPDILGYEIYYATTTDPTLDPNTLTWNTLPDLVHRVNTQFIHLGLTNSNIYYYRISAVNTALMRSDRSSLVSAIPQATGTPEAPTWAQRPVQVVDGTLNNNGTPDDPTDDTIVDAQVILNWLPVTRDVSGALINNVVKYVVFSSKTETGNYTQLAEVPVPLTTYTHTFTSDAGEVRPIRYYKLKAVNSEGLESNFSTVVYGRPNTPVSQPPKAPLWPDPVTGIKPAIPVQGEVQGNQIIGAKIILEWLPVTQDITGQPTQISKYKVYVSKEANGVYVEIGEVYYPEVTYTHTFNSEPGELRPTRFYRVRAINQEGLYSNYSREVYATVNIPTLELLSPQNNTTIAFGENVTVSLHWSPVDGASMYYVEQAAIYDPNCRKPGDDGQLNTPDDIVGCFYKYYSNALSGSTNYTSIINTAVDPTVVYWRVTAKSVENRTIATSTVWKYIITNRVGECGDPVIPSKPQNLTLTPLDGAIGVDWDPNPPEENVVGYRVYWSLSPMDVLLPDNRGDGSAYVNTDGYTIRTFYDAIGEPRNSLPNGTTFYVQVTAITKYPNCDITAFEGFPSEMKSAKPQGGPPPAPLIVTDRNPWDCDHPTFAIGTSVYLRWRPVWALAQGGQITYLGDITGYRIYQDDNCIAGCPPSGGIPGFPVPECHIGSLEYIISNLTVGQQYKFEVSAVSESTGEGPKSIPYYYTPADTTLPPIPQNFTATPDNGRINLTWDDIGGNEVGYRIYWALNIDDIFDVTSLGPTALYADVGGDTVSYTVNRYIDSEGIRHNFLANGTPYFFRLAAINQNGRGNPTPIISATPQGVPPAPRWSTVRDAEYGISGTTATIRWIPVWDDNLRDGQINYIGDLQTYRIYRTPDFNGQPYIETLGDRVSGVGYDVLEYIDVGLNPTPPNNSYQYYITAVSASGGEGAPSETKTLVAIQVTPPAKPTITLVTPGNRQVTIQWTHPSEMEDNISIYEIYGGTTQQLDSLPFIRALSVTQYPQPGTYVIDNINGEPLQNSVSYYFRMQAVSQSGARSGFSNVMAAIPQYNIRPASPTGLTAQAGNGVVYLDWNDSPPYEFVTSYQIWKASGDPPGPFSQIPNAPLPPYVSEYVDTAVTNGTKYTYYVVAVNSAGTSPESPRVFAIPSIGLPPAIPRDFGAVAGNNKVNLSWTANTEENLVGYRIYRSNALNVGDPPPTTFPYPNVFTISRVDTTYEDISVVNDSVYYYYITAYNNAGLESSRSGITMAMPRAVTSIPPLPPAWAQRPVVSGATQITLNWMPVINNVLGEPIPSLTPVVRYRIYSEIATSFAEGAHGDYNDFPPPGYIEIDAPSISYTVTCEDPPACNNPLASDKLYFYKVSAVLSDGTEGQRSTYVFGQIAQPTIVLFTPPEAAWIVADYTREVITSGDNIEIVYSYTANINFAWSRVEGTTRYLLEVSQDPNMISINKSVIIPQSDMPNGTITWEWPDVHEGVNIKEDFYWRVKALSDNYIATAVSETRPFTIASYANPSCAVIPEPPTNTSATGGVGEVTLNWSPPINNPGDVVGYKIYRAYDSSGPYWLIKQVDATTTTYTDRNFVVWGIDRTGEPFYYTFTTINNCGRESPKSLPIRIATPQKPPLQPPSIVTGITLTTCDNSIILRWNASPQEEEVTSYKVYRCSPGPCNPSPPEIWSGNRLTYTDIGLTRGVTYYYKVTAQNSAGESDLAGSTMRSGTPVAVPSTPENFVATAGDGYVSLSWDNLSLTEQDVLGYYIYWAADPVGPMDMRAQEITTFDPACNVYRTTYTINQDVAVTGRALSTAIYRQAVPATQTSYTARIYYDARMGQAPPYPIRSRLANGTTYYFTIQAITSRGEGKPYTVQSIVPTGTPPQVQWSTATGEASTTDSLNVTLRWKPVWYEIDNNDRIIYVGDIIGYKISRDGTEIANVMGTQMRDSQGNLLPVLEWKEVVPAPGTYTYSILAVSDSGGDGPPSIDLPLTATFTAQPSPPTITTQISGNRQITVNWTHPDEIGQSIAVYVIRMGTSLTGLQDVASVNAGTFTYTITRFQGQELTNGTSYYIRIVAVNRSDPPMFSEMSNPVVGTPRDTSKPSIPTGLRATPYDGTVELRWDANPEQEQITHYRIYRAAPDDFPSPGYKEVPAAVRYFSDADVDGMGTPLTNGITYCYQITARRATPTPALESDRSAFVCAVPRKTTPPALPDNLVATAGNRVVQITFDAAPETDITTYQIFRGTSPGGPWTSIATLEHMQEVVNYQYNDTTVTNGVTYYYYIRVSNIHTQVVPTNVSNTSVFPDTGVMPSGGRPSIPTDFVAISGDSQITLRWAARPIPDEEQIIRYRLEKADATGSFAHGLNIPVDAPPAGCYFSPTPSPGVWSCVDTDLGGAVINGTTYFYRLRAENSLGNGPFTNPVYARALSSRPPNKPEWVTVGPITPGNTTITLKWDVSAAEPDLQGYYLERSCDGARFKRFTSVGLGLAQGGVITYVDRGGDIGVNDTCSTQEVTGALTNGITYYYRIIAYNFTPNPAPPNFLESDASEIRSTAPRPTSVPTSPPGLTLTSGDRYIALSWGANPVQEAVTAYRIERNFSNPGNNETTYNEISNILTVREYVNLDGELPDFPVINGRNYTFKVYAQNSVGWGPPAIANCRIQNAIPVSSSPPIPPAWDELPEPARPVMLVGTTGLDTRRIGLAFDASPSTDVWGYYIYRSTSQTGDFKGGPGPDGSIGMIIGWNLPITDGFDWIDDASTGNPLPGQVYYYKVAAVGMTRDGSADNTRISELSEARPILPTADGVIPYVDMAPDVPRNLTVERIGNSARLSWDAVSGVSPTDILGYYIYRAVKPFPWNGVIPPDSDYSRLQSGGQDIIVPQSANMSYLNSGLDYAANVYFYKVSAIRAKGTGPLNQYPPAPGAESGRSNMASPSLSPPPARPQWDLERPVVPIIREEDGLNAIQLTWQLQSNVAGYKVYRSDSVTGTAEGPYSLIGTVPIGFTPNNQFIDDGEGSGLSTATTYYYRIKAYDVNGNESPFSDYVFGQVGLDDIFLYTPQCSPIQTLVFPAGTTETDDILFEWSPARGATRYLVEVSSQSGGNFDQGIHGRYTVESSRGIQSANYSTFIPGTPLTIGFSYYWRVRAYDAHNNLLFSSPICQFDLVSL